MIVFSRAFVRKRVISLATTASVAATSLALAHGPTSNHHARGTMPVQYVADRADYPREQSFQSENEVAMNKMMADVTVKPTGHVDRDFVAMMVPHHQGAIDMAKAFLRYGHNEQLRRMAQEIVVTQQQEIAEMRVAVGEQLPTSAAPPAHTPMDAAHDSTGMKWNSAPVQAPPAGSAIANATGAIRQVVHGEDSIRRRYLVIAEGRPDKPGPVVQVQLK